MKVIKRDGRAVEYNREKIKIAIEKANHDVNEKERITEKQINTIIKYIESLNKKRILVEDIQDIIEKKLMEIKKFDLAKAYIIYRYNRALIRKSNTTDQLILNIIKNKEKDEKTKSKNQKNIIAEEVSKDLTKRILLPEKISKAHEEGIIYFHNQEHFIRPIINESILNIENLFNKEIIINNKKIKPPEDFQTAMLLLKQTIFLISNNQYGNQTIDTSHLGKYLKQTKENIKKEIKEKEKQTNIINKIITNEIKALYEEINTLEEENNLSVTLLLNIKEKDPYKKENIEIIKEILIQKENAKTNPKIIYVLNKNQKQTKKLTDLALELTKKGITISYASAKKLKDGKENEYTKVNYQPYLIPKKDETKTYISEGRFNQGVVTLNLPQIAILSKENQDKFFELLEDRLEICYEALMCKHYALLTATSSISKMHYQNGAISRLEENEKIDKLLKDNYSTLSLTFVGLNEATKSIKNEKEREKFAIKILKTLKEHTNKWQKETKIGFILTEIENPKTKELLKIDKEKFGIIKEITDKDSYTDAYHQNIENSIEKLETEQKYKQYLTNPKTKVTLKDENPEDLLNYIYENINYVEIKKE